MEIRLVLLTTVISLSFFLSLTLGAYPEEYPNLADLSTACEYLESGWSGEPNEDGVIETYCSIYEYSLFDPEYYEPYRDKTPMSERCERFDACLTPEIEKSVSLLIKEYNLLYHSELCKESCSDATCQDFYCRHMDEKGYWPFDTCMEYCPKMDGEAESLCRTWCNDKYLAEALKINVDGAPYFCAANIIASRCCPNEFAEVRASCDEGSEPPSPVAEICDNKIDDDLDTLIDCEDPDCAANAACVFVVTGTVRTPNGKKIEAVPVTLKDDFGIEIAKTYTDESGIFVLDYSDAAASLGLPYDEVYSILTIDLAEKNGDFEILWDWGISPQIYSVSTKDILLPTNKHLDLTLYRGNKLLWQESKISDPDWDSHWDAANVYYETKRAIDFIREDLGYAFNGGGNSLPIPVYVYTTETDTGAFFSPSRKGTGGVFLSPWASSHENTMCPENCVWHELFHFTMYNKYGGSIHQGEGYRNHAGFKNNVTEDSYWEAFAEFWPNILDQKLNKGDSIYAGVWSMEVNYNPWVKAGRYEELAFATLLWDMYDAHSAESDKGEKLILPYKDIWDVLMKKRYYNIKEVYSALSAKWPDKSKEIDALFILHGFFKDKNAGNGKYDLNEPFWDKLRDGDKEPNGIREADEAYIDIGTPAGSNLSRPYQVYTVGEDEIGTASNYLRPQRENKPLEEGSFVKAWVDGDDPLFKVEYSFSDSSLDYVSYDVLNIKNGYVYIETPPDGYDMSAKITVDNYEDSGSISVTGEDYYSDSRVTGGYIKEGNITVGAKKENYCNNNGICEYVEGTSCSDCYDPTPLKAPKVDGNKTGKTIVLPPKEESPLGIVIVIIVLVILAGIIAFFYISKKPKAPTAKKEDEHIFCPDCGAQVGPKDIFCEDCGAKLD